jgi:FXSXX-COOH protein
MSAQPHELDGVLPDLRDLSLERLAELGETALGNSIAEARERSMENGAPLNSFSASI